VARGQMIVEADLVRQIADTALDRERLAHGIVADHARAAAADLGQAEQHQDGGGLARAVRSEQPEDLAARDREGDPVDHRRFAVARGELAGLDQNVAHRRPNLATAPTITRSAAAMTPTPAMPHMAEVDTETRNSAVALSPRDAARRLAT